MQNKQQAMHQDTASLMQTRLRGNLQTQFKFPNGGIALQKEAMCQYNGWHDSDSTGTKQLGRFCHVHHFWCTLETGLVHHF